MPVVLWDPTGCFSTISTGDERVGAAWSTNKKTKWIKRSDAPSDINVFHGLRNLSPGVLIAAGIPRVTAVDSSNWPPGHAGQAFQPSGIIFTAMPNGFRSLLLRFYFSRADNVTQRNGVSR